MAATTDQSTILLAKKFGAMALLLFGFIVLASGFGYNSMPAIIIGVLLLIGGAVLLTLKAIRRNQPPS